MLPYTRPSKPRRFKSTRPLRGGRKAHLERCPHQRRRPRRRAPRRPHRPPCLTRRARGCQRPCAPKGMQRGLESAQWRARAAGARAPAKVPPSGGQNWATSRLSSVKILHLLARLLLERRLLKKLLRLAGILARRGLQLAVHALDLDGWDGSVDAKTQTREQLTHTSPSPASSNRGTAAANVSRSLFSTTAICFLKSSTTLATGTHVRRACDESWPRALFRCDETFPHGRASRYSSASGRIGS